jgi:phosphohistidine phosphatase
MRLIFVRHAPSEGYFIRDDEEADFLREITIEGKKEFTRTTLKALRKNFKLIDVIFTSPLVRAIQTAEMISAEYFKSDLELISDLDLLDNPRHLIEYISFLPVEGTYLFVGHEPHLSSTISSLLDLHPEHSFMKLRKGGVCILKGSFWEGYELDGLYSPKFVDSLIQD